MMLPTSFIFSHNFRILASYNPTILQICFFLGAFAKIRYICHR